MSTAPHITNPVDTMHYEDRGVMAAWIMENACRQAATLLTDDPDACDLFLREAEHWRDQSARLAAPTSGVPRRWLRSVS